MLHLRQISDGFVVEFKLSSADRSIIAKALIDLSELKQRQCVYEEIIEVLFCTVVENTMELPETGP